jgi:hypothetical protein
MLVDFFIYGECILLCIHRSQVWIWMVWNKARSRGVRESNRRHLLMLKWATEAHVPHRNRNGSFLLLPLSSQVWNRKRPVYEFSLTHCNENDAVTHFTKNHHPARAIIQRALTDTGSWKTRLKSGSTIRLLAFEDFYFLVWNRRKLLIL